MKKLAPPIKMYDHIGEDFISAKLVDETFANLEAAGFNKFQIYVKSNGGSIFEGFSIYNSIQKRDVDTIIDGLAASIASYFVLAGKKVSIYKNSFLYLHNPWNMTMGDYKDQFKSAEELEDFRNTLIEVYTAKTNKTPDELKLMLDKGTMLNSQQAFDAGFVDEVIDNISELGGKNKLDNYVAFYTGNYETNSKNSEEKMLNTVLAFMGFTPEQIEAGVSDAEYNAKLEELGIAKDALLSDVLAALSTPTNGKGGNTENTLQAQIDAQAKEIEELKTSLEADGKTKAEALAKEKAETSVNAAIADFKILASQKDTYVLAYLADPDKTQAELDAIAKDTVKGKLKVGETFDRTDSIAIANAIKAHIAAKAKEGIVVSYLDAKNAIMAK